MAQWSVTLAEYWSPVNSANQLTLRTTGVNIESKHMLGETVFAKNREENRYNTL